MKHHLVGETRVQACSLPIIVMLPFPGCHHCLGAVLRALHLHQLTESSEACPINLLYRGETEAGGH